MIVRFSVAGVDEGHAIDVRAEVWENLRYHLATAPAWSEVKGRLHHTADSIGKETCVFVKALQRLSVMLGESRLVIPSIDLTGTTIHEEPDDALGTCWHMGWLRCQWVAIDGGPQEFLILQESGKTEESGAAASALQEIATCDA